MIAIIITIAVLELRPPEGTTWSALRPLIPVLLSYLLSFVFLAIYWNNHHHLFQAIERVDGRVLWANMHLLFWLTLIPFVTGWMGASHFAAQPVALYGLVLLFSAIAFFMLVRTLLRLHEEGSVLVRAIGQDFKGKGSILVYLVAVPLAFVFPLLAFGLYVMVAIIWLVPDRRIEKSIAP